MRGSAAPNFDAKYGIPLHYARPTSADPSAKPERKKKGIEMAEARRPSAPLFSPEVYPQLSGDLHPPPLSDVAAASGQDSDQVRAPRDVYWYGHQPPGDPIHGGALAAGSTAMGNSLRQPLRVESIPVRHDLPRDVVTTMALALGAPARPARAGPGPGSTRRQTGMGEMFASAPLSGASRLGDSVQSFGRMCDLLFFGDDLPIPLAIVEVLPASGTAIAKTDAYGIGAIDKDRVLSCLFSIFCANDQMNRLLVACAQQQIKQAKSRKDILTQDCASKRIIVSYVSVAAGDYLQRLIAPTIRALQGPWTANEAGLKGALDRLVSRIMSMDAPNEMRVALKTVFMCLSKKYGRRAISSLGYVLFGELFSSTVRNIHQDEHMDALTPEGIRFLASMASVLSKLSVNESFAGGSKLYYMNGWIQSRCENFEKGLEKMLTVEGPAIGAWNSGCSVLGSVPNLYVLLRVLTEYKDDINRVCTSDEWQTYSTQSFYQSRLPILWAALDSGRRRTAETFSSPPRSVPTEKVQLPERSPLAHKVAMPPAQHGLIGEMVNMYTQQSKRSGSKMSPSESAASRMEHLSATVTQMDLDSRGLDAVPKLELFKNLQTLNISRNHIVELGELPRSLRSLDCSNNQLSRLAGVECLVNLEVLNCSNNLLEEISSALATNTRMVWLNLGHNRISSPVNFSHMSGLHHLMLDNNEFGTIQDLHLVALNLNLMTITFENNPFCEEAGYLQQASIMLPHVQSFNEVTVESAQFHLPHGGKSSSFFHSPSSTIRNRNELSPFIIPATPSPPLKATSPLLKAGHASRIPDIEHDSHSPRMCPISASRKEHASHAPDYMHIPKHSTTRNDERRESPQAPSLKTSASMLSINPSELTATVQTGRLSAHKLSPHAWVHSSPADICTLAEEIDDFFIHPCNETSQDFWDRSTTNAHKNTFVHGLHHLRTASSDGKSSAIQILAQVAMSEADVNNKSDDGTAGAIVRPVSLIGTGRVGTAVLPIAIKTPSHRLSDFDSRKKIHDIKFGSPSSISHGGSRCQKNDRFQQQLGGTCGEHRQHLTSTHKSASFSRSPHDNRPQHLTRVAASKTSPQSASKKKSPRGSGNASSSNDYPTVSMSLPATRSGAMWNVRKKTSKCAAVDIAEMVIEIEQSLKTMCLVFRGWKLVLSYSRLARHLQRADCRVVFITSSRHRLFILRPAFEAWTHVNHSRQHRQRSVGKRGSTVQSRRLRQLILEWAAVAHFQKFFGKQIRRRLQDTAHLILVGWRKLTEKSIESKTVVYRQWRRRDNLFVLLYFEIWKDHLREVIRLALVKRRVCRRLINRQVCDAFEGFVHSRDRSRSLQSQAYARAKQLQVRLVGVSFMVWVRVSNRKMHVSDFVRNVCRRYFSANLEKHFGAWHLMTAHKAHLSGISGYGRHHTQRRAARLILMRLVFYKDLRVYHRRMTSKIKRLRGVKLLRSWRQSVFRGHARDDLLRIRSRRRDSMVQNIHFRQWMRHCHTRRQLFKFEVCCEALGRRRCRRTLFTTFLDWMIWLGTKREHSLSVIRALHKRRLCHFDRSFSYLRAQMLKGKAQNTLCHVFVRKFHRHFLRSFFVEWNRKVRQGSVLQRRLPLVAERRLECEVRMVLSSWHEVTHRRFQVAAMLDKILLRRKQQHSASPEAHSGIRSAGPRLTLARQLPQSPRQSSTSPRHSNSGN